MTEEELMLTSVLNCRRTDLYAGPVAPGPEQQRRLRQMAARRRRGEPLAYILGTEAFYGLTLTVDRRVLVPRPETEILVERVLEALNGCNAGPLEILDLGTGSGNIAIALATRLPEARVTAVDISGEALTVAQANARRHGVSGRIRFVQQDMAGFLSAAAVPYHVIVSNPPYIRSEDIPFLPEDVQREPRVALDGGPDGLAFYRLILTAAVALLKPGGFAALELGDGQRPGVESLLACLAGWVRVRFFKDYRQTDRVLIAEKERLSPFRDQPL